MYLVDFLLLAGGYPAAVPPQIYVPPNLSRRTPAIKTQAASASAFWRGEASVSIPLPPSIKIEFRPVVLRRSKQTVSTSAMRRSFQFRFRYLTNVLFRTIVLSPSRHKPSSTSACSAMNTVSAPASVFSTVVLSLLGFASATRIKPASATPPKMFYAAGRYPFSPHPVLVRPKKHVSAPRRFWVFVRCPVFFHSPTSAHTHSRKFGTGTFVAGDFSRWTYGVLYTAADCVCGASTRIFVLCLV